MTPTYRPLAGIAIAALIAMPVASADAAARTVKRTATIKIGSWYNPAGSRWQIHTQSHGSGRYDLGWICLNSGGPRWANVRISAYDSRGHMVRSWGANNVRFFAHCQGLRVDRAKRATRFVFRVNPRWDGVGERARGLSVQS